MINITPFLELMDVAGQYEFMDAVLASPKVFEETKTKLIEGMTLSEVQEVLLDVDPDKYGHLYDLLDQVYDEKVATGTARLEEMCCQECGTQLVTEIIGADIYEQQQYECPNNCDTSLYQ